MASTTEDRAGDQAESIPAETVQVAEGAEAAGVPLAGGPGISTLEGEAEAFEPPSPRLAVAVGFPVTAAATAWVDGMASWGRRDEPRASHLG